VSTTTNLALTLLEENQDQAYVPVNELMNSYDDIVGGRLLSVATKTATASIVKTNHVILSNHSAAATYTLPAVSGANAPRSGQKFIFKDRSSAGAGTYNITIAVPSGAKIDNVTDGTVVIAADRGWIEVVFDGTDYWVTRAKGVLTSNDLLMRLAGTFGFNPGSNAVSIPAANATPSWLPFMFSEDVGVDAIIFPFGSSAPTSDATDAKIRLVFYESSSSYAPTTIRYASEDFKLQGSGHVRSTTLGYGNIGSVIAAVGVCVLSTRRYFKGNTLYFLGMHYENTFSGATVPETTRGVTPNPVKLAAGAQAWPYTFASTPSLSAQFSADDELRPDIAFRYRRIADIY